MQEEQQNLERQVERGNFYLHTVLAKYAKRINELESFLYGFIDLMVTNGLASQEELKDAIKKIKTEIQEHQELLHADIVVRTEDKEQPAPTINCEERLPICKAICCKLHFPLSIAEVESGKTKWDLGRPYFNRKEQSGYCTHMDKEKSCCNVYEDRPLVCRQYSCANDSRIWKDFEKMELNEEWIQLHLQDPKLKAAETMMIQEKLDKEK